MPRNGVYGGVNVDLATAGIISGFTAIGWVNAIEVILTALVVFKGYRNLYFWSVIASASGAIVHGVGGTLKLFSVIEEKVVPAAILYLGWWFMVTGQAAVLYSRLHLIVSDQRVLNFVKYMICIDFVLLCVVQTTFGIGANLGSHTCLQLFTIYERIQVTGFCLQEFIISGIYIYETRKLIQNQQIVNTAGAIKVFRHLIAVNIIVVLMDCVILGTEYANFFWVEVAIKPAIYTYKLRLEFSILNRLMGLVATRSDTFIKNSRTDSRDGYFVKPRGVRSEGPTYLVTVRTEKSGDAMLESRDGQGVILATTDVEVKSADAIFHLGHSNPSIEMLPTVYYRDEIYSGPTSIIAACLRPCGHCDCCMSKQ